MTQETNSESAPTTQEGSGDLFNTAAGWVLFAAGLGLGLSILSDKYFHGYDPERPETAGYPVEVAEEAGEAEMTMAAALNLMPQDDLIAAGERVFAKCSACHTIEQGGANGVGPNLYGVMGSSKANVAGFSYSSALAGFGGNWGWEEMNEWLDNPRGYIDGTSMGFNGISSIEDRAAVAMYMNANGANIPVPEYVEEAAEGSEEAAEGADAAEEEAEAVADETAEVIAEQNDAEATSQETAAAEAS